MYFHKPQEKPRRWGSFQDVQYAIRKNAEKIYQVDPDSMVLCMPLFWGLPPLDYSGKNNHGTNYGATYKDGGLGFDGVNDYVEVAHSTSINFDGYTDSYSFEVWVKSSNPAGASSARIVEKRVEGIYPVSMQVPNTDDDVQGVVYDGLNIPIVNFGNVWDGNWHHLVFVVDNSGDKLCAYTNGSLVDWTTNTVTGTTANNDDLYIGNSGNFNKPFNGLIGEVRISNVVRTADQIALFHDRPWDLYRPVSRPVYFLPTEVFVPRIIIF